MKTCTKCKRKKQLNQFYKSKRLVGGHEHACKRCRNKQTAEWKSNNRKLYLKYKKKHYYDNAEYYKNTKLLRKWGISIKDYEKLLKKQNSECAICKTDHKELKTRLAVDYCHKTGKIRGLLCDLCNRGLGYFKDDPKRIKRAISYVTKRDV